ARSSWLNSVVTPIIKRILNRRTDLEIRDYAKVLGLRDEYRIAEIDADEGDWITGSPLAELDLPDEGVRVLAIERQDGSYIGAPGSDSEIQSGDTAVFYGQENRLQELADRDQSDTQAHEDAVEEHNEYVKEQEESTG
ncbi:TrkA-C domain protein, partial [Halococcus morrhuae DSM 1307]